MGQNFYFGYQVATAVDADYPLESDVRYGVDYGDGVYTGTLVLPSVSTGTDLTPAQNLMNNIAASSTFQSWTGSSDYIEALTHIYENGIDENTDLSTIAPYAYIRADESSNWTRISFGLDGYIDSGSLELHFDSMQNETDDPAVQLSAIVEKCDKIMREILASSGSGGYLAIESADREEAFLSDQTNTYQMIHVKYIINWR